MHFLETRVPAPIVAAVVGAVMKAYAAWSGVAIDPSAWRMHVGVGLSQLSAIVVLAALIGLWRARTTLNPFDPTRATALVTSGVFRFSRNPMYLSLLLLLVAYAIRLDALLVWVAPVFFVAYVTRLQIAPEERVLMDKFGARYAQYMARTRRWI